MAVSDWPQLLGGQHVAAAGPLMATVRAGWLRVGDPQGDRPHLGPARVPVRGSRLVKSWPDADTEANSPAGVVAALSLFWPQQATEPSRFTPQV